MEVLDSHVLECFLSGTKALTVQQKSFANPSEGSLSSFKPNVFLWLADP
jgi:hypothetical protein